MKSKIAIALIVFLVFAVGFGACFLLHPVIFPLHGAESIPVIYDGNTLVDPELIITLIRERIVLYNVVDQQRDMIAVYEKMIEGYDTALGLLMQISGVR